MHTSCSDKHSKRIDVLLKVPGLGIEIGALEASIKTATGVLDAAKGVMNGSAFLGEKAALETASKILDSTRESGKEAISTAQATVHETDITTKAALNTAQQSLAAIAHGPEQGLVNSTRTTLNNFIAANQASVFHSVAKTNNRARVVQAALKAANDAIANVTQAVEYAAYQTALHSLAVAQQSTLSLKALQLTLDKTQEGEDAVLNATKVRSGVIVSMQAVQLTNLHSGSLTTGRSSAISPKSRCPELCTGLSELLAKSDTLSPSRLSGL
jgi:hypothetical protein